MMDIGDRYHAAHAKLIGSQNELTKTFDPDKLVQNFAVCTANLTKLKETIEESHEYGGQFKPHHKFQRAILNKVTNSFRATYILVYHNLFTSAYQDIRFQYESFAVLRGVNDDLTTAGEEWNKYEIEAKTVHELGVDPSTFPFDYVDYLGSRRQSGKDKLAN